MGRCTSLEDNRGPPSNSLRVQLVEGPIHTDRDLEEVQPAVLPDLVHHSCHASPAELSCPPGHHRAHLLHDDAVVARGLQAEVLEDGADLEQGQAVAGGDTRARQRYEMEQLGCVASPFLSTSCRAQGLAAWVLLTGGALQLPSNLGFQTWMWLWCHILISEAISGQSH